LTISSCISSPIQPRARALLNGLLAAEKAIAEKRNEPLARYEPFKGASDAVSRTVDKAADTAKRTADKVTDTVTDIILPLAVAGVAYAVSR
jgi:hypothetical protein